MRIGVDYTAAVRQGGGIGRYTRELMRAVVAQMPPGSTSVSLPARPAPAGGLGPKAGIGPKQGGQGRGLGGAGGPPEPPEPAFRFPEPFPVPTGLNLGLGPVLLGRRIWRPFPLAGSEWARWGQGWENLS